MEFSVGSVLSRSLSTLFKNLVPFVVIGLIVYVPVFVAQIFLTSGVTAEQGPDAKQAVSVLIRFIAEFVVTGALVYGVFQSLRQKPVELSECLSVGLARLLPVIGVGILVAILIWLGLLLLIVPGIILACMLYVAVPVAVVEKPGVFASLSRSADLTKGHRWTIFAIFLVILALALVIGMVLVMALATTGSLVVALLGTVIALFFGLWSGVAQAVVYHDLRKVKEGIDIEDLAKVFD